MPQETLERRVRVIPATRPAIRPSGPRRSGKQRVAAYCRVSTDSEEQLNSYAAQMNYYTQKIEENPDWEMAGVFADEGITGTTVATVEAGGVQPDDRRLQTGPHRHDPHQIRLPVRPEYSGLPQSYPGTQGQRHRCDL